jgi:hypothetical protein
MHKEHDLNEVRKFMSQLARNMYISGHSSPITVQTMGKEAIAAVVKERKACYLLQIGSMFDHMLGYHNAPAYDDICDRARRRKEPAPPTKDAGGQRPVDLGDNYIIRITNGTIFLEIHERKKYEVLYLTPKDIKRICETLNGMAQTLLYPQFVRLSDPTYDNNRVINRVLAHIASSMMNAPDPNRVARFYDVGLHTLMASWSCDMNARPLQEMRKKYEDDKLQDVGSMDAYLSLFRGVDYQPALDAARVYKLLPCPDFDPYVDFAEQARKQGNKNTWFADTAADITEDGFEAWRHLQAVCQVLECEHALSNVKMDQDALIEEYGSEYTDRIAEAILERNPRGIPLEAAKYLDITGCLAIMDLDSIVPETLKDKSLCPKNLSGKPGDEIDASGTRWETNYLLEHCRTRYPLTADECLTLVATQPRSYYHKVFFKAENKKAHARNCYSAQSICRKALSKVELTVAEYLRHRRGNANGVPDYVVVNEVLSSIRGYEGRTMMVSFDISGWSPNMALQATQSSLRKWANMLADDRVVATHRVLLDGIAVWNHGFLKQSYALAGTDIEGYYGRLNTDYHIDVMTYALHIMKKRMANHEDTEIEMWSGYSATLQVMIDDGLLILRWGQDKPPVSQMPDKVQQYISDTIEEVYRACSLKLSWDKTLISSRCCTFLNEFYVDGRHIGNGLRSYVRIRPDRGAVPEDHHEKCHRYVAMAQGALKSGAPMVACILAIGMQLGMELGRTKGMPKLWAVRCADMLMLPTCFGGAAMPSITVLGASAGGDALETSVGNCLRIAQQDAMFNGKCSIAFSAEAVDATPLQVLRNPEGVHTTCKTITCGMLRAMIGKKLLKIMQNVELRELLKVDLNAEAEFILQSLDDLVATEAIERAYSCSRVHLIDRLLDKFKQANSLAGIMSRKQIRSIDRANQRVFAEAYEEYCRYT